MRWSGALLATLALSVSSGHAQRAVSLAAAPETVLTEMSRTLSAVEASENRLLVIDNVPRLVFSVDWRAGTVTRVGRLGAGPNEYRTPTQLLRLNGDTVLLIDAGLRRWSVISDGRIVGALPPEMTARFPDYDSGVRGVARDWTSLATVLGRNARRGGLGRSIDADSLELVAVSLRSGHTTKLTALAGRWRGDNTVVRVEKGTEYRFRLVNPFGVEDQAWIHPDGAIVIVRANPYRVAWLQSARDPRVRYRPLSERRIPVDDAERAFAIRDDVPNIPPPRPTATEYPNWPDIVPPFPNSALIPLQDGRIAIERTLSARDRERSYDIVARDSDAVVTLRLPPSERIVAFGARHIYTMSISDEGELLLLRRTLPTHCC